MKKTTRATLLFPRTGQRIKIEVPEEQYEAVVRRNNELIHYFSRNDPAASERHRREHEEITKISTLSA